MGCIIAYTRLYMWLTLAMGFFFMLWVNSYIILEFFRGDLHFFRVIQTCASWLLLPIYYAFLKGILWVLEQLSNDDKVRYRREIMAELNASED